MKLIDADALLKQIAEDSRKNEGWYGDTWGFINTIKDAPTIDAVPVVRCRDCIYYDHGMNECETWSVCDYGGIGIDIEVDQEDFCSLGERRTDETN